MALSYVDVWHFSEQIQGRVWKERVLTEIQKLERKRSSCKDERNPIKTWLARSYVCIIEYNVRVWRKVSLLQVLSLFLSYLFKILALFNSYSDEINKEILGRLINSVTVFYLLLLGVLFWASSLFLSCFAACLLVFSCLLHITPQTVPFLHFFSLNKWNITC